MCNVRICNGRKFYEVGELSLSLTVGSREPESKESDLLPGVALLEECSIEDMRELPGSQLGKLPRQQADSLKGDLRGPTIGL